MHLMHTHSVVSHGRGGGTLPEPIGGTILPLKPLKSICQPHFSAGKMDSFLAYLVRLSHELNLMNGCDKNQHFKRIDVFCA